MLLATAHVLTRPWCLLELYETWRLQKPFVVVIMVGGGSFDLAAERAHLDDLEASLRNRDARALALLEELLPRIFPEITISQLGKRVGSLLGTISADVDLLKFHAHGSDSMILSTLTGATAPHIQRHSPPAQPRAPWRCALPR